MGIGRDRRQRISAMVVLVAVMGLVIVAVLGHDPAHAPSVRVGSPTSGGTTPGTSSAATPGPGSSSPPASSSTSSNPSSSAAASSKAPAANPSPNAPGTTATTKGAAATPDTTAAGGGGCPSTLAAQLATTGGGSQLMTVQSTGLSTATVTVWQRAGGCWALAMGPWPARVGYNGMSTSHREGDGTTPIGVFGIGSAFYGIAVNPGVHGSYHQLVCGDWWDEDPTSPQYNTFQHVACGATPPFGGGSEALWQATGAYQHFAVVNYNVGPVIAGAGSAIFIHDDVGGGTNGCVSLAPGNLDALLTWLQPPQSPHIVIGTATDIRQY